MDPKNYDLGRRSGGDRRKIEVSINFPERRKCERRKGERRQIGEGNISNFNYDMNVSNTHLDELADQIHKLSKEMEK